MFLKNKKLFFNIMLFFLIFTFTSHQISFARRAGGGDLAEFDTGKWAVGTAINLGSMAIGSAVAQGVNTAFNPDIASFATGFNAGMGFGSTSVVGSITGNTYALTNIVGSATSWANMYTVGVAVDQVGRAVQTAGRYYEWDPGMTIAVSSIAQGIAGGALDPGMYGISDGAGFGPSVNAEGLPRSLGSFQNGGIAGGAGPGTAGNLSGAAMSSIGTGGSGIVQSLAEMPGAFQNLISTAGSGMAQAFAKIPSYTITDRLTGAAMGAIQRGVQGGVLAALADSNGQYEPWAGAVAGLAGTFAGGVVTGGFAGSYDKYGSPEGVSFGNTFNAGNALGNAVTKTIGTLPVHAFDMGVNYIAQSSNHPQDQYMIRQAFSGVRPIVGAITGRTMSDISHSLTGWSPPKPVQQTITPSQLIGNSNKFMEYEQHLNDLAQQGVIDQGYLPFDMWKELNENPITPDIVLGPSTPTFEDRPTSLGTYVPDALTSAATTLAPVVISAVTGISPVVTSAVAAASPALTTAGAWIGKHIPDFTEHPLDTTMQGIGAARSYIANQALAGPIDSGILTPPSPINMPVIPDTFIAKQGVPVTPIIPGIPGSTGWSASPASTAAATVLFAQPISGQFGEHRPSDDRDYDLYKYHFRGSQHDFQN